MKKEEFIKRYGEERYAKHLELVQTWKEENPDKIAWESREWRKANPECCLKYNRDQCRKGGKRYQKALIYNRTGLQGERRAIRHKHQDKWKRYKNLIAPSSQIHHSWLPGTVDYSGVALVEAEAHMHGIIKVIKILDGEIRLFTEKEIREQDPVQYASAYA